MTRQLPWVGHWSEPWNRSPWDRCLWQIKWENIALLMLMRLRKQK